MLATNYTNLHELLEDLAHTALLSGPNYSAKVEFDSSPSCEKSFCLNRFASKAPPIFGLQMTPESFILAGDRLETFYVPEA